MKHHVRHFSSFRRRRQHTGVSLVIVIVIVMMMALLAFWAMRSALFAELVTSNEADYQRAYQAAQSMVQDAKDDIVRNLRGEGARDGAAVVQFPEEATAFEDWAFGLSALPTQCQQGLCLRRIDAENFWDDETTFEAMVAVGARYAQYSGLPVGEDINPILKSTAINKGAWYWIEPMLFEASQIGSVHNTLTGATAQPVQADMLYRITAIALGMKGASTNDSDLRLRSPTMAVIQTIVALPTTTGE